MQAAAFEAALAQLTAAGAVLRQIDFTPFYDVADLLYDGPWVAERRAALGGFFAEHAEAMHPVTRAIIGAADAIGAAEAFRGIYRLAELRRQAEERMQGLDLLCVPSIPTVYRLADLAADPLGPNSRLGTYTNFVNLLDLCGIAVPSAARSDGLPGSVTLLARAGQDGLAAGLAARLSPALPPAGGHGAGETVVAAVGAHMSGLPLNGELTRLGARCLGPARTAAAYRLFALGGGSVPKPGMLRVEGQGAAIEVELWALPTERVGAFMAGIPAPLSIGTVSLADGSSCKGFLVEAAAVAQARDITGFGGWRAYLASLAPATAGR